jgi:hypothetical protein
MTFATACPDLTPGRPPPMGPVPRVLSDQQDWMAVACRHHDFESGITDGVRPFDRRVAGRILS